MGYETIAESVALLKRFGNRLIHLHLNDNYRYWDDDMIPGSVHTLEWVEFFYWLDRTGYDGWYSLDIFAFREKDKIAVARESLAWLETLRQGRRAHRPQGSRRYLRDRRRDGCPGDAASRAVWMRLERLR